ncbi:conserved hypothetical protein [Ricinus communis]|uniref:Uncharacterized protein n=1 Tax=Ricinus communis TaxID=3988 RepID=B9RRW5_RICCO|nr:conserved hypothetical protein [Ricinus communis]
MALLVYCPLLGFSTENHNTIILLWRMKSPQKDQQLGKRERDINLGCSEGQRQYLDMAQQLFLHPGA